MFWLTLIVPVDETKEPPVTLTTGIFKVALPPLNVPPAIVRKKLMFTVPEPALNVPPLRVLNVLARSSVPPPTSNVPALKVEPATVPRRHTRRNCDRTAESRV